MSEKYKVGEGTKPHFITITIVDWVDLFTRKRHKDVVIESLDFCQKYKGLIVHEYVVMPSHVHLIVSSEKGFHLPDTIRDFKKHTSRELIKSIQELGESRRRWLLNKFRYAAKRKKRGDLYKVWKDGFHPVQLSTDEMIQQRTNYVHQNPVKDGIVVCAESYMYSSASRYHTDMGALRVSPI